MPDFGVCSSNEERCGLSFESYTLNRLFGIIAAIEERTLSGGNADELTPHLSEFIRFFQTGAFCSQCSSPLVCVTQPTAGLAADSEERRRRVRSNQVLGAGYKLRAMGVLPVP